MKYILFNYELLKIQQYFKQYLEQIHSQNIQSLVQSPYLDLSLIFSLEAIQKKSFDSSFLEKIEAYILRGTGIVEVDLEEKNELESLLGISFTHEFTEKEVKKIKNITLNSTFFNSNLLQNEQNTQLFLQSTLDVNHIDSCINYIQSLSSFKNFDISLFPKKIIQNKTFQLAIIKKFPESIDFFYSTSQDILLFLEENKNKPILLIQLWEHLSKKEYFFENENTIKKNQNTHFAEMSRYLLENIEEFKYQAFTNRQDNFQEKIDRSLFYFKELEIEHKKNLMILQKKIQGYKKIIAFYEKNVFHNEENIFHFFPLTIQSIQTLKLFNPLIFQKDSVLNDLFSNKICLDEILDKFPLQILNHIQNSLFNALLFENLKTDPKENHKILKKRISFLTQTSCMNEKNLISILDYLQQSQKNKKLFVPFILQEFINKNPIFIQNSNVFEHFFALNPLFLFSQIPENQKQNDKLYVDYLLALKREENKNNISSNEFSQYKNMIFSPNFVDIVVQSQNQNLISLATSFFDFFQIENCPKSFKTHAPYLLTALQKKEIDNLSTKEFLLKIQKLQLSQDDYIALFHSPNACDLLFIHRGAIYFITTNIKK